MSETVNVLVQTPYGLSDDSGTPMFQGEGVYSVKLTDRIQNYINLGQLSVVKAKPVALVISEPEVETKAPEAPVKKTRASAQKQENSDG